MERDTEVEIAEIRKTHLELLSGLDVKVTRLKNRPRYYEFNYEGHTVHSTFDYHKAKNFAKGVAVGRKIAMEI